MPNITSLVQFVFMLLIVGMIFGLLYWLVQKAPFIPDPFKPVILWILLAIMVAFVILEVLLPLLHGGPALRIGT